MNCNLPSIDLQTHAIGFTPTTSAQLVETCKANWYHCKSWQTRSMCQIHRNRFTITPPNVMLLLESLFCNHPSHVTRKFFISSAYIVNPCKHAEENSIFIDPQIYNTKPQQSNIISLLNKILTMCTNTIDKFSKTFLDLFNLYFCLSNFHCKQEYEQNNHKTMPTDIRLSLQGLGFRAHPS